MKNGKYIFLAAVLLFCMGFCACGAEKPTEDDEDIYIMIEHELDEEIAEIGAKWYLDGEVFGSVGMRSADARNIEQECVIFRLQKKDVPEDGDLRKFSMKLHIMNEEDRIFETEALSFPVSWEQEYLLELIAAEDGYRLIQKEWES